MNISRALVTVLLLASTGALARAARTSGDARHADLAALPYELPAWTGRDAGALDPEIVRTLAADAYVNRTYADASRIPVGLYIAYYGRQQPGVSVHSPLHCLPGTGWEPLDVSTIDIAQADGSPGQVRRLLVRKNLDRAVVIYWYAVHGRMLASETMSKAWLLHDSVLLHRSDAALVRIVIPVSERAETIDAAERQGLAFARDVLPYLSRLWS
jgi:EpsI family protein